MNRLRRALLAAALAALAIAATALGGSGVGSVFNLGQVNTSPETSTLTGAVAGPQLSIRNTSTDANATALSLNVGSGRPPFKVSSSVKVAALNADKLDGLDASGLWQLGGNAAGGTAVLGTTTNQAVEFNVDAKRVWRVEPATDQSISNLGFSPNIIGGFSGNSVAAGTTGATIAGGGASGYPNSAAGSWSTIGGGFNNKAGTASADFDATVAGGASNTASASEATIGGGGANQATGFAATVGGGEANKATSYAATVAGGDFNTASNQTATVVGGYGNIASGDTSTVLGRSNTASGTVSMAAGYRAKADDDGAFIWGDSQQVSPVSASPGVNTFSVRAGGGIWLGTTDTPSITTGHFIDTSTGAYLGSDGAWSSSSDRAKKRDFRALDKRSVLDRVARMPVTSWSYKVDKPSIRHIGPTAQDFYAAFGLGLDDKHITSIDEGGVALAAIQGLYRENRALKARLARLERTVSRLSRSSR